MPEGTAGGVEAAFGIVGPKSAAPAFEADARVIAASVDVAASPADASTIVCVALRRV
jgi:hypothetical protein